MIAVRPTCHLCGRLLLQMLRHGTIVASYTANHAQYPYNACNERGLAETAPGLEHDDEYVEDAEPVVAHATLIEVV